MERAGIKDLHWHDLRHDFASQWMMRGGSLLALQKQLGHHSITQTEKYAHLAPDYLRAEAAKTDPRAASEFTHGITQEQIVRERDAS